MITPVELQSKVFKSGFGYDKKDVDSYLEAVLVDYEKLYKNNLELTESLCELKEKLKYYRTIERTLQKALILAEKTAETTKQSAKEEAEITIKEARLNANTIVSEAKNEVESIHRQSIDLIQQYELYKAQFKQLAMTQYELINSDAFKIQIANLSNLVFKEDTSANTEEVVEEIIEEDVEKDVEKEKNADPEEVVKEDEALSKEYIDMHEIVDETSNEDKKDNDDKDNNDENFMFFSLGDDE